MRPRPIETAPDDGTYIILFGPSGYTTTPLRAEVCHYDAAWVNHSGDSFLDGGGPPTCWLPLPDGEPWVDEVRRTRELLPPSLAKVPNIKPRDQTDAELALEVAYWEKKLETAGPAAGTAAAEFLRDCQREQRRRKK